MGVIDCALKIFKQCLTFVFFIARARAAVAKKTAPKRVASKKVAKKTAAPKRVAAKAGAKKAAPKKAAPKKVAAKRAPKKAGAKKWSITSLLIAPFVKTSSLKFKYNALLGSTLYFLLLYFTLSLKL